MPAKSSSTNKRRRQELRNQAVGRVFFRRWEWVIVLIALICAWNSGGHQFVMDDYPYILQNPAIQDPVHAFRIFVLPLDPMVSKTKALYRPLTSLTLALNLWTSGPRPNAFQLLNRVLHILVCLGIFWSLRLLIRKPSRAALFTALLFAVHPIQTEAITYISGRADALATLFFIFGWYYFIRLRQKDILDRRSYWLSVAFYLCALFSKESAVTWLGVVWVTDFIFYSDGQFKEFFSRMKREFLKIYAGYLGATLAYLVIRIAVLKQLTHVEVTFLDNPLAHIPTAARILTSAKILLKSIGLVLWPVHLSADYSFNQIALLYRWNSLHGLIMLFFAGLFLLLILWTFHRDRVVCFGLAYFLITYFIVGNFLIPIGTIRADRLLYMPALGILLIAGVVLGRMDDRFSKQPARRILHTGVGLLLALLAFRTIQRNRVWQDEFTLYSHTAYDSPQSAKAHNNLGAQYFARNEFDRALEEYRIAESIKPDYPDLLNNLGSLFTREQRWEDAIRYLRQAVVLNSRNPEIGNNLGLAYRYRGDFKAAIAQYDRVLAMHPLNADAHFNRGNALYAQGQIEAAVREYNQTLEIDPNYEQARNNLLAIRQKLTQDAPLLEEHKK